MKLMFVGRWGEENSKGLKERWNRKKKFTIEEVIKLEFIKRVQIHRSQVKRPLSTPHTQNHWGQKREIPEPQWTNTQLSSAENKWGIWISSIQFNPANLNAHHLHLHRTALGATFKKYKTRFYLPRANNQGDKTHEVNQEQHTFLNDWKATWLVTDIVTDQKMEGILT